MTDLETLLRTTLTDRADTITTGPAWDPAAGGESAEVLDLLPPRVPQHPRRSGRIAMLVAAAAVVAVVVGIVVEARHGSAPNRAAHSGSPTTSHSAATVTRAACATGLPASWRNAAATAATPIRQGNAIQLPLYRGTTADGEAVIEYGLVGDGGPHLLVDHVGLLAPGSAQVHELVRVSTASGGLGLTISVDQNLIVIAVEEGKNNTDRYSRILAVDAQTGVLRTVTDVAKSAREQLTGAAYPFQGHVYWETTSGKGWRSDRIRDLDMTTGQRSVVARGVFDLESSAAGIAWSLTPWRLNRPAALPPVVRAHVHSLNSDSFVTDGSSYAWVTGDGSIEQWSPSTGSVIRVPNLLAKPFSRSEPGSVFAVAGPIVIYQPPRSGSQRILDVRTGATAEIAASGTVLGRLGHLVGNSIDPRASEDRLMDLATSTLPELHC